MEFEAHRCRQRCSETIRMKEFYFCSFSSFNWAFLPLLIQLKATYVDSIEARHPMVCVYACVYGNDWRYYHIVDDIMWRNPMWNVKIFIESHSIYLIFLYPNKIVPQKPVRSTKKGRRYFFFFAFSFWLYWLKSVIYYRSTKKFFLTLGLERLYLF